MSQPTKGSLDLSDKRQALLEALLREEGVAATQTEKIQRRPDSIEIPLSFAQQRLWFLDKFAPGNTAYNIHQALAISGPLNIEAFKKSLTEILVRHEALRTSFPSVKERPRQVISPDLTLQLPVVNLSNIPVEERQSIIGKYSFDEASRPFDLEKDRLLRTTLLRMDDDEHVLLLTMHHIVSDGWSMDIFFKELGSLYEAYSNGRPSSLPELAIQYPDFSSWQRGWLQGEVLQSQLSYWKEALRGAPMVLQLPLDKPRPSVQTFHGKREAFFLSREMERALKNLGQKEGATLFMTLLAAFNTLLFRYSGQDDILVGSPIANRNRSEIEGLIGFFVNTLVLRVQMAGEPSFRELLGRVREMALEAYAHQDLPFEKLVEELQPDRSPSYPPIFQVLFALQNATKEKVEIPSLKVSRIPLESGTVQFDLILTVMETSEGLKGSFEYNSDLFESETIHQMASSFQNLLKAIIANPDQSIAKMQILSESEEQRLLEQSNHVRKEYKPDKCLHRLFEERVELTPNAIALSFEDKDLTYRDLNTRANQLAHFLRKQGVGANALVGICMERSLEMIVAILGVLKAGGAYLPLDLAYPNERIEFILEDANTKILLTQKHLKEKLPPEEKVISLDSEWDRISKESSDNLSGSSPEDLAYLIYTSGSTGHPKGVMISHYNVVRLFQSTQDWYAFNENDVWTMFHSYAFDFSVWEIWGALLYGGRLVVVPYMVSRAPDQFHKLLVKEQITVLNQTPSAFRQLIQADESSRDSGKLSLRLVIFGGEALELQSLKPWYDRLGDKKSKLVNMYGITETTVHVSYRPLNEADVLSGAGSVIGVPLPDLQLYVLDKHMKLAPVGVCGEMYVGGEGLARGYLKRPELTTDRFLKNPYSQDPKARLYKTGDLARRLWNGDLEYLGRIDHQIKIRGFRIELGEIESVLMRYPGIREVVVLLREDNPQDKRLVAYLVIDAAVDALKGSDLRSFLKEYLPEYMVPVSFVTLDKIPLTTNGKVDRNALPAPDQTAADEVAFLAPRDPLELQLTKIWENVLGVKRIGIRDNFFDLGGHSLLAVQLFTQIEKMTGKNLPLVTLFQAPTVEQLAVILRDEGWIAPWSSLVAIQPGGSRPPFYCIHGVGGNIVEYLHLARYLGEDQPFYGVQAQGLDGKRPRHNTAEEMAAHYIVEIRALQPEGPYFLGGSSFGGSVAYEIARQLHAQGQKVGLLALFDTNGPGYGKLLPTTTYFKKRLYELKQRAEMHFSNLALLEPENRPEYVREKAGKVRKRIRIRFREFKRAIRKKMGMAPLPMAIKKVQESGNRAADIYVPQPYQGKVTLFRATQQPKGIYPDPTLGWEKLALGGLEIHDVPGHHGAIVREPRVRLLAKKLNECLKKNQ